MDWYSQISQNLTPCLLLLNLRAWKSGRTTPWRWTKEIHYRTNNWTSAASRRTTTRRCSSSWGTATCWRWKTKIRWKSECPRFRFWRWRRSWAIGGINNWRIAWKIERKIRSSSESVLAGANQKQTKIRNYCRQKVWAQIQQNEYDSSGRSRSSKYDQKLGSSESQAENLNA